jgi:hypothetical protein
MRGLATVLLPLVLLCGNAVADDYVAALAADVDGLHDTATSAGCTYISVCQLRLDRAKLMINLAFDYPNHRRVLVHIWGYHGCCYFRDGVESLVLNPTQRLHILQIYEGRARRGDELVLNKNAGTVYLGFSNLK